MLTSTNVLAHFDSTKPLILSCDASSNGIGAVLSHGLQDGGGKPIAFASRTLTASENNYSQIENKGLAIVFGVKSPCIFIWTFCTDNKALLTFFNEHRFVHKNHPVFNDRH